MSGRQKLRNRRILLFHKQCKLCYWCRQPCILVYQDGGQLPDNAATIDHLRDKFDRNRGKYDGTPHTVMSCAKCNRERGIARNEIYRNSHYRK